MAQTNTRLMEESYKVIISVDQELAGNRVPSFWTSRIVALLPEDGFSLDTSAEYSSPFSLGAESLNKLGQIFKGQTLHVEEMGKTFWKSSEPIEMSLSLKFVTWRDPYEDVVKPSLTLNSLPLPAKLSDNTAMPPIKVDNFGNIGKGVNVDLGPLGALPVLPQSASVNFSGTLCESPTDERNWPVASEVDFGFKVAQKPTKQSLGTQLLGNG